jgi:hypothetical protein
MADFHVEIFGQQVIDVVVIRGRLQQRLAAGVAFGDRFEVLVVDASLARSVLRRRSGRPPGPSAYEGLYLRTSYSHPGAPVRGKRLRYSGFPGWHPAWQPGWDAPLSASFAPGPVIGARSKPPNPARSRGPHAWPLPWLRKQIFPSSHQRFRNVILRLQHESFVERNPFERVFQELKRRTNQFNNTFNHTYPETAENWLRPLVWAWNRLI